MAQGITTETLFIVFYIGCGVSGRGEGSIGSRNEIIELNLTICLILFHMGSFG